jgi:hypothetical protein
MTRSNSDERSFFLGPKLHGAQVPKMAETVILLTRCPSSKLHGARVLSYTVPEF